MSALKNKTTSSNLSQFREKNSLLFFFNYNHINTQEWRTIKSELSKTNKIKSKVVKTKIAHNVVKQTSVCNPFLDLFQGPTFLLGTTSPQEWQQVSHIIEKQKKLVFVGGFYQGQPFNHLDLSVISKGEERVHTELYSFFQLYLYTCTLQSCLIPLYSLLKEYSFLNSQ